MNTRLSLLALPTLSISWEKEEERIPFLPHSGQTRLSLLALPTSLFLSPLPKERSEFLLCTHCGRLWTEVSILYQSSTPFAFLDGPIPLSTLLDEGNEEIARCPSCLPFSSSSERSREARGKERFNN